MFYLRAALLLQLWFLWPARVARVFLQRYRACPHLHHLCKLSCGRSLKHNPFVLRDRLHHPAVAHLDLVRQVEAGELLDLRLTMHRRSAPLTVDRTLYATKAIQKLNNAALG